MFESARGWDRTMSETKNSQERTKDTSQVKLTMIRGTRAAVASAWRVVMVSLAIVARARVAVTGSTRHGEEKRIELLFY